jgi:hypothetical protein
LYLLSAALLVRPVVEIGYFSMTQAYAGALSAVNAASIDYSERIFPRELQQVVEEEKARMGITAKVDVKMCPYYGECRKAGTSYAVPYGDSFGVFIQPHQMTRSTVAHELSHVKHDFSVERTADMDRHHYWLVGEPRAALAGLRKTF